MKFKDAVAQGLVNKDKKRRNADVQEQASARKRGGKPERRKMPVQGDTCRCGWPLSLHRDGFICEYEKEVSTRTRGS